MKTRHYISLLLSLLFSINHLAAQNANRLYIPQLTAVPGGTVSVPFYVENTAELVAVQFTLQVPEGSELSTNTAALTNRAADHTVTVRNMAPQEYLCMIYSPNNRPIKGRSGKLLTIDLQLGSTMEEGSTHEFVLKDAVLSLRDGTNALSSVDGGSLTLINRPDLKVQNVQIDKSAYAPGDAMSVSWQVENVGGLEAGEGWTEQISLVQGDGTSLLIGTTHYDGTLASSGAVSRQATVTLPELLGLDGEAQVQVQVVPLSNTGESEGALGNNIAVAPVSLSKKLVLTLPTGSILETYSQPVRCTLARSGNRAQDQIFALTATADSRLAIPQTVTIPAGQSAVNFYIQLTDNETLDDGGLITVTATGNSYEAVTGQFAIEDNEYPDLKLTASKSQVNEGESFQLTVTATRVPGEDVEVSLSSEVQNRFAFPAKVVLPAGQSSVTVEVTVNDDDVPSLDLSNAFTAYAPGYNKGEVVVILEDDDIPALELTLTPGQVSEGVGPVAVAATLRRTGVTSNKITVKLSDDSEGGIYYGTTTIEMPKGVEEVHFNLGPIDNANVDGDRTVNITAAVYISSCSCNAQGESAGIVSAQLAILDDDGPALTLKSSSSTVKEGGKVSLTVSRNTSTAEALTVALSGDKDAMFEDYSHSITIPAGSSDATIELTSKSNDVSDDSFTAIFTASTDGFSKGSCFLMVTDQTLPDARIASFTAEQTEVEVGGTTEISIVVTNDGAAVLPAGTTVTLYEISTSRMLRTTHALAVNETETLTATVTLPSTIGSGRYYAVINESNTVKELNYNNNTSVSVTIHTISPFTASVSTDKAVYKQGESVQISGQLTGNQTAEQTVEVYVINEGARQTLTAKTDATGAFTASWTPYSTQCGHFIVGACFQGENLRTEMAAFDMYGLKVNRSSVELYTTVGESSSGSVTLSNPGQLNLTGVTAEVTTEIEGTTITLQVPGTLDAGSTIQLNYTVLATKASAMNQWDKAEIRISAAEGATATFTIKNYAQNAHADLVASTSYIKTTVVKDTYRDYPLDIVNTGKGASGAITLALPSCMTSLSGTTLASLEQGDTASVVLRFLPTDNMQLNIPVKGSFGINCANGNGTSVSFEVTPVSEATGTLVVDVMDELSYYTTEAPHVEGASVELRNPATNALVAQGVTGADGLYTITLPEGYYQLTVTSANHDSYRNNILVDPGVETRKAINLSIQAIKVDWDVKETEIEDVYDIVTTVKFETNVPVPVVVVDVPQRIAADELAIGESLIFTATATNKGLIAAKGFTLEMPDDVEHLLFEPLTEYQDLTLAANTSVTIPIRVTRVNIDKSVKEKIRKKVDVMNILRCIASIFPRYYWDCGPDRKWHRYKTSIKIGECKISDPEIVKSIINIPPPIIIVDPISPGYAYFGSSWSNDTIRSMKYEGCEPCQNRTLLTMLDCGLSLISRYKQLKGVISCAISTIETAEVIVDESESYKHKAAAFLGTVVTCKNAIVTGKGDKNQTHQQQREQAIETLLDLLGDIVSKVGQDDFDALKDWDNVVDMVGSAASIVKDLAGFDYDDIEEVICPLKLLRPCDYDDDDLYDEGDKHSVYKAPRRAPVDFPSYLTGYRHAVSYGVLDMLALTGLRKEFFGDINWLDCDGQQLDYFMQTFQVIQDDNGLVNDDKFKELEIALPEGMTIDAMKVFVERWNNTIQNNESKNSINLERVFGFSNLMEVVEERISADGYADLAECIEAEHEKAYAKLQEATSSVCASITLQFKQSMYLTRQAFRGTLTVFNGHETNAMENVKLNLTVTNVDGTVATSREFEMHGESLDVFEGDVDLTSGWTLGAQETGTATVLFIPSKYAAPTEPVQYSFGGTLTYTDPFSGLEVTRILTPITLTVKPTPELDLTYFMQRDVYGDDPLTEAVEPMEPAEFSLLINNIGYGDATNVRMVTNQPEIVDNEKGLLIDFEILSAQLNGGEKTLALGGSIPTDFGTIPAHSQAYAQWWFQSSLLGHFTDYDVQATHVTSYGNPDLSLLNDVTIHELIRSIKVDDGEVTGFVVNDLTDAEDTPDMVYFTDGTTAEVALAADAVAEQQSNTEYWLTVNPSQPGWNYGRITDPTFGRAKLVSIQRQSDGSEINLRNFWQTDRTLRDGKDWLYENNLHFVDQMANSAETYVLTFEPRPDVELEVASVDGVPEEGTVIHEPLQTVIVTFNKAIDAETFTREDITLNCQGSRVDVPIAITPVSDSQFTLDLSLATAGNGYYTLTIQTADITDLDGFTGAAGKTVGWIQFTEATTLALSFDKAEVTYGDAFTEPKMTTNSPAIPVWSSANPLVASVNPESGKVAINAVGSTKVSVDLEETPTSDAVSKSYLITVMQPEGLSESGGAESVEITIPEGHTLATFCYLYPIDFADATDDCRAYVADRKDGNTIYCTEVKEAKGGVGLLMYGKSGVYTFPVKSSSNEPENLLVGTLAPTFVETSADGMTNFGLKDDKFVPMNTGVVKANKAYLPLLLAGDVKAFNIVLDGTDGVSSLVKPDSDAEWYDIMGVKVARPVRSGIYIRNGKKVVVK